MKLSRKQISVFPTQHGFLFLAILIAMMIGAVNYNNNAGFILVFLLGGMALISVFHSFKNLEGIEVSCLSPLPVFAGQTATFPVHVNAPSTGGRAITFSLVPQDPLLVSIQREKTLQMGIPAKNRGILNPKFLTLKSVYPFGMFTFYVHLSMEAPCLVYPRPIPGFHGTANSGRFPDGKEETSRLGTDDFQGLKQYEPGHSINRISWTALSRGRGLFIKDFTAEDSRCIMLDLDGIPGRDMEFKLSRLCDMILTAEGRQMEYGLRLPGFVRNPARGKSHQHHCLKALALFNLPSKPGGVNGPGPKDGSDLQKGPGLENRPAPGDHAP
jgi:uncharacterized protein (DUF58 family)